MDEGNTLPKEQKEEAKQSTEGSLKNIVTAITILAFLYGITNLSIYYTYFSFNIFEFIDLSEIVTSIIRDAMYICIAFFVVGTLNLSSGYKYDKTHKPPIPKKITEKGWVSDLLILSIIIIPLIYFNVAHFIFNKILNPYVILGELLLVLLILMRIYYIFKPLMRKLYGITIDKGTERYLVLALLVISLSGSDSVWKIDSIAPDEGEIGTSIIVKNDTIKSTHNYYYIGRTKGFVFFYNGNTKATDVYQDKDISKFSLK